MQTIQNQCQKALEASKLLSVIPTKAKNQAINKMASNIIKGSAQILKANETDLQNGKKKGLTNALLDRLALNKNRVQAISDSFLMIEKLADPTGEIMSGWSALNGLKVKKIRVPLGVVGIIYEARPNVTADAVGLCIKTGNSVVLRGSSSAYNTNLAISNILKKSLQEHDIPKGSIQLLEDTSRKGIETFVKMDKYLSVIIPRGGAGLIQNVVKNATVPAIETGMGNCHIYVDKEANLSKAIEIIINAKTSRPSVCNACETLLIHEDIAREFLPIITKALKKEKVDIRGCKKTRVIIPQAAPATKTDWETEYLDYIIAIKIVTDLNEAIDHIDKYGTRHSEAILSENITTINEFSAKVDAAAIVINTSTRFIDGGEFGFGAEIGISTQKLHARGPMGLPELTTYKYIVEGQGQVRN
ncbi:glutamate-5-semialdehyde dehydrogenase [Candidatus Margulisiibacteriota bacterium]